MRMFRGDLKPDLELTLTDGKPATPVDLTGATAIRVIGRKNSAVLFDRAPTELSGAAEGVVVMEWQPADTAETGRVYVEVEVTWPGGKPQTFRSGSVVDINADYA